MTYDCIVAGTGGVGSAALFHLARRGATALGIDRFPTGHDRGSSHGDTRIIRLAYHEHPHYVPMLKRAYRLWDELVDASGDDLYTETGLLEVGPPDGILVRGVLRSAHLHDLDVEEISAADLASRFGGFTIAAEMKAVFERRAGFLRVEACVRAHAGEAVKLGAELRTGETVLDWRRDGNGFQVTTDRDTYRSGALIVSGGAWNPVLLRDLDLPLEVRRKPLLWYHTDDAFFSLENRCPMFLFETGSGFFYGFPKIDDAGVKVARHTGGETVSEPLEVRRDVDRNDREPVESFLRDHLPGVSDRLLKHTVCLYTMSPDEHFIVDRHPAASRLVFAAGLSGHGFKFTPVLGEVLATMALGDVPAVPIDFLALDREALR